jgi:serine/threonine-protein kinase
MKQERWRQIERIHNSALEREPGEREAFLEGACAGDAGLRKEVERLLGRQQEAEDFIERPALEVAARVLADDLEAEPVPDLSGTSLSHYRIIEKLGKGGMGAVYRATDTKLRREVAIKVIPDAFARDANRMARFSREAHVLAALNHPNIAAIYGIEESALVMELVEGPTLAERIASGADPGGRSAAHRPADRRGGGIRARAGQGHGNRRGTGRL